MLIQNEILTKLFLGFDVIHSKQLVQGRQRRESFGNHPPKVSVKPGLEWSDEE